jgi:hypothetical protein
MLHKISYNKVNFLGEEHRLANTFYCKQPLRTLQELFVYVIKKSKRRKGLGKNEEKITGEIARLRFRGRRGGLFCV